MRQRSYNAESLLIGNDCVKLGDFTLFENRTSPYFISFDPLIGRASLHKALAAQLYEAFLECSNRGVASPFLLGNPVYGIPMVAALTQEIYEKAGSNGKGRGLRFGYFVKEEDSSQLDRDPEKTVAALLEEHGNIGVVNILKVESMGLRGDDLAFVAQSEARHLAKYIPEISGIVASGYSGMPFATAIANEMLRLGKDLYVAYERLSTKAYDPMKSHFIGRTDPKGGKAVIVTSSERPDASGFYGLLQEGDEVIVVDDVAGREKPIIDNINRTSTRNTRVKISSVLLGVDRMERDGTKELAETLAAEHITLRSLTTSNRVLDYWANLHDDARKLSPKDYQRLSAYQAENAY